MVFPKLFRKKSKIIPGDIRLFFDFKNANVIHSNNISKEVHTKKKYYHEVFCSDLLHNVNTDECVASISDIAIYISTSFIGTNMEPLKNVVERRSGDYELDRYPLFFFDQNCFAIYLKDIIKHCIDIHAEMDHKDGKCQAKYIFHCADNENDFDIYLVLYSSSVSWDIKNYLLNPDWIC